ncbi:MAG: apolipoprotein N-acyltransferase [Planctomycetota bacterium]
MAQPSENHAPSDSTGVLRPEIQKIIQTGRTREVVRVGSVRWVVILSTASLVMLWACYTPLELAPLAWLSLVPMAQLMRLKTLPRWSYSSIWFLGFAWSCITLQWLRLGHPAMYAALAVLSFYIGMYFPAFVWLGRRLVSARVPLWLTVAIVWTMLEYLRAWLMTGFSWYYLGHSQYRWLSLIQISDITGAYGVSFLIAAVNGAISECVPCRWLTARQLQAPEEPSRPVLLRGLTISVSLVVAAVIYGLIRQTSADQFRDGPAVALIQGNFDPETKADRSTMTTRIRVHEGLTQKAIELQPQFIVWPETMFPWPLREVAEGVTDEDIINQISAEEMRYYGNETDKLIEEVRDRAAQNRLATDAQATGAAMILGLVSTVTHRDRPHTYNSASFARPDLGYVGRYDKNHLVMFGEYIPLRTIFPWLIAMTPFGPNFGMDHGTELKLFEYSGVRVAPLICFEDTVPHLVRRMAAQKDENGNGCDVLVNLTNDAWFRGSSELDQHLITSVFRCVENHRPMVRAVNGGISAFIDGNGQIRDPDTILVMREPYEGLLPVLDEVKTMRDEQTGRWRRQFSGIIFAQLPLDDRTSIYTKFGDAFSVTVTIVALLLIAISFRASRQI